MTNEEFENTADSDIERMVELSEPWYDELAEIHFKAVTPLERLMAIEDLLLDMKRTREGA